jgi:hypothetical protein
MATHDVPGKRAANADVLAMGCWAEHEDGSLIFVESTEGGRVVYSVFDLSVDPPIEYRDAMEENAFKRQFSYKRAVGKPKKRGPGRPKKKPVETGEVSAKDVVDDLRSDKWLWHDKTPFPWDRVIGTGVADGFRHASADGLLTAAQRVMQSRKLSGKPVDLDAINDMLPSEKLVGAAREILDGFQRAINRLGT